MVQQMIGSGLMVISDRDIGKKEAPGGVAGAWLCVEIGGN